MHTVGLIAEYNPFHGGHRYQLQQIRQKFPESAIVVVMSGNIVQRGEFAVLNKWQRAQLAIENQADLVIELPLWASLQSADHFAFWAVDLLGKMKIDHLVFGSYGIKKSQFEQALIWVRQHQSILDYVTQDYLQRGYAYPAAMQAAIDETDNGAHGITFDMSEGNSLLGFQYLKVNQSLSRPMTYDVILRSNEFLSGSQIRKIFHQDELTTDMVPTRTFEFLNKAKSCHWNHYFPFLKYQVLSTSMDDLRQIQGMKEGFEYRLKKMITCVDDYESLIRSLTSKRWARSSIQRLLMMVLLNTCQDEWHEALKKYQEKSYVRILGFNQKGRQLLNEFNKTSNQLNTFSNLTQEIYPYYSLMIQADYIYQLGHPSAGEQNIGKYPFQY